MTQVDAQNLNISVVLPVFFRHASVEQIDLLYSAIESVLQQDYLGEMEIVLIDDGSPIPVRSLLTDIKKGADKVRWLRLSQNQGIVAAMNAGIEVAEHRLIARMDADDLWLPGKLAKQLAQFQKDPDLTISATGMARVDTNGKKIDEHIRPGDWTGILNFFVEGGCPFPHGSIVAEKQIYRLLGGYSHNADTRHCEDYALWSIWLRFFKPTMVEEALYSYRVSDSSVSFVHAEQQSNAAQHIRQNFEMLDLSNVLPKALPALAESLGSTLLEAGTVAYKMWNFRQAMTLPVTAQEPLAIILPDRVLLPIDSAPTWQEALGLKDVPLQGDLIGLRAMPLN